MYSEEVEKIRKSISLVDILNYYNIPINKKNDRLYCNCPFHKEKNGYSLLISENGETYRCLKCGAQGNAFIFIRDLENIRFFDAIKIVKNIIIEITKENKHKKRY